MNTVGSKIPPIPGSLSLDDLIPAINDRLRRIQQLTAPAGASGGSGAPALEYDDHAFGCSINCDLTTGSYLPPALVITAASVTLLSTYAYVKVAAVGADVKASLWLRNTTKIQDIVIPAGSTAVIISTNYLVANLKEGDLVTCSVDQAGTTTRGQTLIIVVKFRVERWV